MTTMEDKSEYFEISAVSGLTGISSHVLRVWERRYQVVEPKRSESGRRMYSSDDIRRLGLLKALVDQGHSIGSVANLSTEKLDDRLSAVFKQDEGEATNLGEVRRLALVGTKVRQVVLDAAASSDSLQLVGEFDDLAKLTKRLGPGSVDIVIYEKANLFPEHVEEVQSLLASKHVRRVVFIYHFASEGVLENLDTEGIIALRAPVGPIGIRQACEVDLKTGSAATPSASPESATSLEGEIPARLFSDEELAKVSKLSTAINCECPRHIEHLISALFAFEEYSEQCENRNEKDAELHAFLHRSTANCRRQMENALSQLLKEEGITL